MFIDSSKIYYNTRNCYDTHSIRLFGGFSFRLERRRHTDEIHLALDGFFEDRIHEENDEDFHGISDSDEHGRSTWRVNRGFRGEG